MELIEAGKIINTHGIHGDIKIASWASYPEILLELKSFFIDDIEYEVEKSRIHKGSILIKLVGINSINEAEVLKNKIICARKNDIPLDDNEFFIQDLIGLSVIDVDTQQNYGKITEVYSTGANDVYEVVDEDKNIRLVPAIKDCIISTDLEEEIMLIKPLEGLFDI